MTPKSTHNKARAKRIADNFKRKNPGKTPLKVIAIWPKHEHSLFQRIVLLVTAVWKRK